MFSVPKDALCLKLYLASQEWGPAGAIAESDWQLVPPSSCGPCHCLLDTVHQAAPEESMFGASSAQEKKKEKEKETTAGKQTPLFRETSLLLQSLLASSWPLISIWLLAQRFHQKKKKKTPKRLQTLNTMSWQRKAKLSHSTIMPVLEPHLFLQGSRQKLRYKKETLDF